MDLSTIILFAVIAGLFYRVVSYITEQTDRSHFPWAKSKGKTQKRTTHLADHMTFNKRLLEQSPALRRRLETLLIRSGHPFGWRATDALFMKEIFPVGLVILVYLNGFSAPLHLVIAALIGFFLPDQMLKSRAALTDFLQGTAHLLGRNRLREMHLHQ